jgi:seryl-tRNA synthetase
MLDLRYVTENVDEVRAALERRGFRDAKSIDRVAELAAERKSAIAEVEDARAKRNEASQKMASLDKASEEFAANRVALRDLGGSIKEFEKTRAKVESELQELLLHLPNLPGEGVPDGLDESANREVHVWGDKPTFDFEPADHVEVGTRLGGLDFERAAKLSGARFVVLKGATARLNRALMQLMLDTHTLEHGYTEVVPPVLVKDESMRGTGQLPKFASEAFRIAKDDDWAEENEAGGYDLYLIPTAEVPVTNLHRSEILDGASLPVAYTAYTPCFRSEAGSYGKDTRGMIRQHQFDKVELVRFVRPELAEQELELLTSHAEAILQKLGLHYRRVELCAGDLGFSARRTFDLEVWLPGQNAFREISSCSWFGDFQARRLQCRYRPEPKGKPALVHTINGSGLAIGRTLVAILEQYQRKDGGVTVPEALRPYLGGLEEIFPSA